MNAQLQCQPKVEPPTAQPSLRPARTPILQRKCACGGTSISGMGGDCNECKKDSKGLQLYSADRSAWSILSGPGGDPKTSASRTAGLVAAPHSFSAPVRKSVPAPIRKKRFIDDAEYGYGAEEHRDQFSEQPSPAWSVASALRFAPAIPGDDATLAEQTSRLNGSGLSRNARQVEGREPSGQPMGADAQVHTGLIADDDTAQIAPGQMRKAEFLNKLEGVIRAAADSELARVERSTEECPYIARLMGHYQARSARHLEAALRRYASEAAGARSVDEYMPAVARRVRRAAAVWVATGRITEVPDELARKLTGGGAIRAIDAVLSRMSSALDDDSSKAGDGDGDARRSLEPGAGNVTAAPEMAASRDTAAARETAAGDEIAGHKAGAAGSPGAIGVQLGPGGTLDSGVKSRMESAFGYDFSSVRVHTDSRAAAMSANLSARAFTVGNDIAFGAGEYRPGSVAGEALIAHELAHVMQQDAATATPSAATEENESDRLEEDADTSAFGAVASLWGGVKGFVWGGKQAALNDETRRSRPQLRSGLRLSRCSTRVDQIKLVNSAAGAINGFPAVYSGNLDKPGPFNNTATNGVSHVLQVHFHLDSGKPDELTPHREVQRTTTQGSQERRVPEDEPAQGGVGQPKPGGFAGVLVGGDDGPPNHEIKRPSDELLVVADAPGWAKLRPTIDFPAIYKAHFKLSVANSSGEDVAMIRYDVLINKQTATEVPNTENRSVVVEKRDIARGKSL